MEIWDMWAPAPASLGKLYSAPLQLAEGMTASPKSNTTLLNIPGKLKFVAFIIVYIYYRLTF